MKTRCKTCEEELTEENRVNNGKDDNDRPRYRTQCKSCYAVYMTDIKKPSTNWYENIYINLPNTIANTNSQYGWMS